MPCHTHTHDSQMILRHVGLYELLPQSRHVGIRYDKTTNKRKARCV